MNSDLPAWEHALGRPSVRAVVRQRPDDFVVDEVLGFEPDGEGDHAMLLIRKRGQNTEFVARQLARLADVRPVAVGYAGLKDRQAVTSQWFTVDIAGRREPDWSSLDSADLDVLRVTRQRRKLKRGSHHGNRFIITLRDIDGDVVELEKRLQAVRDTGVPNYFGEQRFGHDNIAAALSMFRNGIRPRRQQRSLYLSAARSLLFNNVLAERIRRHCWQTAVDGDVMVLDGSRSHFAISSVDDEIRQRCLSGDIHPGGPLWGRDGVSAIGTAAEIEQQALQHDTDFCRGLERAGLAMQRRPLRLLPRDLGWDVGGTNLTLEFSLPAGAYATAVLRELVSY